MKITDIVKSEFFNYFGTPNCRFHIPVRNGTVYMRTNLSNQSNYYIIMADRERFLASWKNQHDQEPQLTQGGENEWRADYKFQDAEKGFAEGYENPVSLADASCSILKDKGAPISRVGFTNGITRTIWLLANDAKVFPISTSGREDAELMQRCIGVRGCEPIAISELYSLYKY